MTRNNTKQRVVRSKRTGQTGVVIKSMGNSLWVKMDDGTEWSGAKQYWTPVTGAALRQRDQQLKGIGDER